MRPAVDSTKKETLRIASLVEENEALRAQLNSLTGSNDVIPRITSPAPAAAPMPTTAALPKLSKPVGNLISVDSNNANQNDLETGILSPPRHSITVRIFKPHHYFSDRPMKYYHK